MLTSMIFVRTPGRTYTDTTSTKRKLWSPKLLWKARLTPLALNQMRPSRIWMRPPTQRPPSRFP